MKYLILLLFLSGCASLKKNPCEDLRFSDPVLVKEGFYKDIKGYVSEIQGESAVIEFTQGFFFKKTTVSCSQIKKIKLMD